MSDWVFSHAWMTPQVFAQGGPLELATDRLREMHGTRALSIWQRGLMDYAHGRECTSAVVEAYINQSLEHHAFYRAAAYASVDLRFEQGRKHNTAAAATSTQKKRPQFGAGLFNKSRTGRR